ncbi:tumor-associated calcium signal transducer 2 [Platysternon megacephalum]|uniref:Protein WWC3 n=1 Tax=Platysternon megacephalum TaxID=55544 RepID=A0A4D9ETX1_9SAUR|nr:protein WWC3 [Platysternon megacephalum]TFK10710.1 tumor-associated calcium signal transducer 2 [Platysternon megacephalum]
MSPAAPFRYPPGKGSRAKCRGPSHQNSQLRGDPGCSVRPEAGAVVSGSGGKAGMTQSGHFHKTSFNISQENEENAQRKGMKNNPHARSCPHPSSPHQTVQAALQTQEHDTGVVIREPSRSGSQTAGAVPGPLPFR